MAPRTPPVAPRTLLLLVVCVWLAGWLPLTVFGLPDKAGEFGDNFGAINSLFSGLAFAGVIYTLLLQQLALEAQQREHKQSAEANRRQLHMQLQQMAMEDEDLQEVWGYTDLQDHKARKQHAYINLVLSKWEMDFVVGDMTEAALIVAAERYMAGTHFSAFWTRTRDYRTRIAAASADPLAKKFHSIVERAWANARTPEA